MGWEGVDLIPLRAGETKRDAISRIYWDESPNDTTVTKTQRRWMLATLDELDAFGAWDVVEKWTGDDQDWPWSITLEARSATLFVDVCRDELVLRLPRRAKPSDEDWRFWWKVIQLYGQRGYVAFESEDNVIVATSLRATAARERYRWF